MEVVHEHNLNRDPRVPKPFGIRVRMPPHDPFVRLLGQDWERYHWYASRAARARALGAMSEEHLYSRRGDRPALVFEPVERPEEDDSLQRGVTASPAAAPAPGAAAQRARALDFSKGPSLWRMQP